MNPVITALQRTLDDRFRDCDEFAVLEAGCGSTSVLDLGDRARITGIDISQKQLDRNSILQEKILGDVQTHPLPQRTYDLIVCWDVLEHLPEPRQALENFERAAATGGLIVLKLPNLLSPKGLLTKFTPHGFHVWVYRHVYRCPDAGTEDRAPFPTQLRLDVSPGRLCRFATDRHLAIVSESYYESNHQIRLKEKYALFGIGAGLVQGLVKMFSLGRLDARRTEYLLVLKKGDTDFR